jgi:hypothetical protein
MKRTSTWLAAPVLAAASLPAAFAADPVVNPWALRAGPSAATEDTNNHFGFHVGASRAFGPGRVDIDFARHSHEGTRTRTIGASYVHRLEFGRFYGGLGVGAYHLSVHKAGSGGGADKDKFSLGGKLLVGFNITQRIFTELSWNKVRSINEVDPSNVSLVLGFRF